LPEAALFGREQLVYGKPELSLFVPHRRLAEGEQWHPFARGRGEPPVVAPELLAAQLGRLVAQREVPVAALPRLETAHLAANPQRREAGLDDGARASRHLAHGPSALGGRRGEQV